MKQKVIEDKALERIQAIHQMSLKFNQMVGCPHQERLLELMRDHIDEIQQLAEQKDAHYLIETGDLLILCFELLLEGAGDIDEVLFKCFGRYEKKLMELMNNVNK